MTRLQGRPHPAVYCAPLSGHPGAYRARPADAEPYGDQDVIVYRNGDEWRAGWGLLPGVRDVDEAAQAAVAVMAAREASSGSTQ